MSNEASQFTDYLFSAIDNGTLRLLVLSAPVRPADSQDIPQKQTARPVLLKGQPKLHWELQFEQQQTHLNLDREESAARLADQLGTIYREGYLHTADRLITFRRTSKRDRLSIRKQSQPLPASSAHQHDRRKNYLIPEGVACRFLESLGIMTPSGHVRKSRQKKFRQINRYLEFVNDLRSELPEHGPLRIVDFGCGLSYLTFAVHHLFSVIQQRDVELLGIDQNDDVIARCRSLAAQLNLSGMTFETGRIESTEIRPGIDLAISLHACDTATDAALEFAVRSQARAILAVPCCQHEVFRQIACRPLEPLLQHGILKERFAAMATDALRVAALEAVGYRAQLIEFIDLEHTPKNVLIRAVKQQNGEQPSRSEYDQFKSHLQLGSLATDRILEAPQSL